MRFFRKSKILLIGSFLWSCAIYAENIAEKLNHDWNNINRENCKINAPDYYCSGVIAHIFDKDSFQKLSQPSLNPSDNTPWMPSQAGIEKGSISFSYLRQDIPVYHPLFIIGVSAGYIFEPLARLVNASLKEYTLLCEYPEDAFSDRRPNKGCGAFSHSSFSNITDLSTCKKIGISTPEDYEKSVLSSQNFCSAAPDLVGFSMMLDTIKLLGSRNRDWNELIIQEWSDKENKNVPLEAFFYEIQNKVPNVQGKAAADSAAKLYRDATNIDVPVVAVDMDKLSAGEEDPFTYETSH